VATARKLAELYYRALKDGIDLKEPGSNKYDLAQRERQIKALKKRAAGLGLSLISSTSEHSKALPAAGVS
jgi:hypothetical protein